MPFDLQNLNPAAKFYWGKDKKEWVELRNIPVGELRRIRKETIKRNIEYYRPDQSKEKPFRYEIDDLNEDRLNELLWDYQIVNWHIEDPDGNEIPCTLENKLLLMSNSTEFAEWIIERLNQLVSDEKKNKKKQKET